MDIKLENVESEGEGWLITIQADLEPSLDRETLHQMEDWEVTFQEDYLYLQGYFDLSEPWEDEPLEEIVKAALKEVEWMLKRSRAD
ncbi:MAG: hypothetical protein ABFC91_00840 [Methanobacteriaceae archaeon]